MNKSQRRLYEMEAEIIKAAGHPIRLAIIGCLRKGERCVCVIAEEVGAGRSNVSRHLAVMTKAGLLSSRKDGLKMMYTLRTPCVLNFMKCVEGVLRENAREASKVLQSL